MLWAGEDSREIPTRRHSTMIWRGEKKTENVSFLDTYNLLKAYLFNISSLELLLVYYTSENPAHMVKTLQEVNLDTYFNQI